MRLRWHFRNNEDDYVSDKDNSFKTKSTWQPPKDDPGLENYLSLLEKEVMSVSPESKNYSNLSSFEQLSLLCQAKLNSNGINYIDTNSDCFSVSLDTLFNKSLMNTSVSK